MMYSYDVPLIVADRDLDVGVSADWVVLLRM